MDLFIIWLKKNNLGIKLNKPFIVSAFMFGEPCRLCLKSEKDESGADEIIVYMYPDMIIGCSEEYYRKVWAYELLGMLMFDHYELDLFMGHVKHTSTLSDCETNYNNDYLIKMWLKKLGLDLNTFYKFKYKLGVNNKKTISSIAFQEEDDGSLTGLESLGGNKNCFCRSFYPNHLGILMFADNSKLISN